jgi:phage shock protein A
MGIIANFRKNQERKKKQAEVRKKLDEKEKQRKIDASMNRLKEKMQTLDKSLQDMSARSKSLDEQIRNAFRMGNETEARRKCYTLSTIEKTTKIYDALYDRVSKRYDDMNAAILIHGVAVDLDALEAQVQLTEDDIAKILQSDNVATGIRLEDIVDEMDSNVNGHETNALFDRYREECKAELAGADIIGTTVNTPNSTVNTGN